MSSPFVPWDTIAERYVEATGDPQKLKAFYTLTLGLPFEMKGDTLDHVLLMERREHGLERGRIPPNGLILVGSRGRSRTRHLVRGSGRRPYARNLGYRRGILERQPPKAPDTEVFEALRTRVLDRDWPTLSAAHAGSMRSAIDSGYRSPVVYAWTRQHQRVNPLARGADVVLALKGTTGWNRPAIGLPSDVDFAFQGKRVRAGAKVRTVGIDGLKGVFMADLAKEGMTVRQGFRSGGLLPFPRLAR